VSHVCTHGAHQLEQSYCRSLVDVVELGSGYPVSVLPAQMHYTCRVIDLALVSLLVMLWSVTVSTRDVTRHGFGVA